ncbi:MAG: aminotransferase class V-fold PLP-dependent enzyme [Acidimicrobiia bacterium]|nr:aminotransferase class V-fold PLP-dependent enzyme [Acidimicrobiia bacterium]
MIDPGLFSPEGVYLNTATYGLPPTAAVEAMREGVGRWRRGIATMAEYDAAVAASRRSFATIVGADPERVAVASQASVFAGLVANSLPPQSHVLLPSGEFTSLLFPFLVQRHVTVTEAPFFELADAVDDTVDAVAFSLVRSNDGAVADSDRIVSAARRVGARIVVDATQAAGWLPFDPGQFDFTIVSGYKWLLCPRGTAFAVVGSSDLDPVPVFAGWYAGEDPWASTYGSPLRLAASARRYDLSPAWLAWVGAQHALELIASVGVEPIHAHDVELAARVRSELGQPETGSAMVTFDLDDPSVLARHGIASAVRAGSVRVGFHLYNTDDDVDRLLDVISPGPA